MILILGVSFFSEGKDGKDGRDGRDFTSLSVLKDVIDERVTSGR